MIVVATILVVAILMIALFMWGGLMVWLAIEEIGRKIREGIVWRDHQDSLKESRRRLREEISKG